MCWIEVSSRAIGEEVLARVDADPRAIRVGEPNRGAARGFVTFLVAFGAGVLAGLIF
jgi:hypothetical protein